MPSLAANILAASSVPFTGLITVGSAGVDRGYANASFPGTFGSINGPPKIFGVPVIAIWSSLTALGLALEINGTEAGTFQQAFTALAIKTANGSYLLKTSAATFAGSPSQWIWSPSLTGGFAVISNSDLGNVVPFWLLP